MKSKRASKGIDGGDMPTLQVNEVRVEYSEIGSGEPIVMVHSAPGTAAQWRGLSEVLKDTYRLLAVNLHGIGDTAPWQGPRHLSVDDDARVVCAVVRSCDAPVHLVGHSYGGAVCMRVALASPAQLRSLTLIEPMVYSLLRWAGEEALFAEAVGVVEAFFVLPTPAATEAAWRQGTDRYHGAGAWAGLPETARAALLARTPIVIERCHALLSNPTSPDDCRRLGVRTLVLCGDRTGAPERRLSEIVAGLMRDCSFRLIAGAGHMSPLTHPVEVAAAIRAHLTRVAHGALAAPHDLLQRTEVRDAHRGR